MKKLSKSSDKNKVIKNKKNSYGFTLIELLATITILSIVLSISIYFVYEIVDSARNKSYQVTISNIEKEAGTYVLENASSVEWINANDMSYQYQCVSIQNLIDTGYFSNDILNSKVDKDVFINKNNMIFLERNMDSKTITNIALLVGDRTYFSGLCNASGNITFKVEPNGWTREKDIMIYYNISNSNDDVSNYIYSYNYFLEDDGSEYKKLSGSFNGSTHQEVITVDKNGDLIAKINSGGKELFSNTLNVTGIDDKLPNISIKDNSQDVSGIQNVLLNMSDDESGLDTYYFGTENPQVNNVTWISTNGNQSASVDESGTWYLGVRDKVGQQIVINEEFYKTNLVIENVKESPEYLITIRDKTFKVPEVIVKDGYYFVGWYTNSNYDGQPVTEYTPTGNGTLYGKVVKMVTIPLASTYCRKDLVYIGSEQILTNEPEQWYTFSNNRGIDSGDYIVKAKLNGDNIWEDGSTTDQMLTCSIAKADITPVVLINGYTYNGVQSSPSVNGNDGNGVVTYYYNTSNSNSGGTAWTSVTSSTSLNANTYYMYATIEETSNYNSVVTNPVPFTISKAECTCIIGTYSTTLEYPGDASGNITYSCGGDGTINVISNATNVMTVGNIGTIQAVLTAVDAGTSKITVSRGEGTNYNVCKLDSKEISVSASEYTITYDANGGSGAPDAQMYTYASSGTTTLSSDKPTRTGYTFLGWSTSSKATSATYNAGGNFNKNISKDTILYAIWKINKVYISFNINGGTIKSDGWTVDSEGMIYYSNNNTKYIMAIDYGTILSTDGLPNYNNSDWLNIVRTGYSVADGYELKCLSGCAVSNKTYSQTTVYKASDFCDASNGDCTVVLGVNWKDSSPPTCALSVTTSKITMTVEDNEGVTNSGMSTSSTVIYNGKSNLSFATGTTYGYVKDASGNTGSCSVKIIEAIDLYTCSKSAINNLSFACSSANFSNPSGTCTNYGYNYYSNNCSVNYTYTATYQRCDYDTNTSEHDTWSFVYAGTQSGLNSCSTTDFYCNNMTQGQTKISNCQPNASYSGYVNCYYMSCDSYGGTYDNGKCYKYNQTSCSENWTATASGSSCESGYTSVGSYCYKLG